VKSLLEKDQKNLSKQLRRQKKLIKQQKNKMNKVSFIKALLEMDEASFSKKYNDDPKLKGGQKNLPDELQAQLIKKEGEDHEVSMAANSLKSIISSASQLMNLLGQDEKDIPAWIQDHITNAENYINQASKNYHEYNEGATSEYDMDELPDGTEEKLAGDEEDKEEMFLKNMMEDLFEAKKKKPSAGLTKKQKSTIVKKAKAGKDMGKKGKGFEKIVKAAKKSGADNPEAVAGAAFWKGQAKKAK
jgi:hypothetical protein